MKRLVLVILSVVVIIYAEADKWILCEHTGNFHVADVKVDPTTDNFIIASNAFVVVLDRTGKFVNCINDIPHNNVRYVEFDHLGNLWIGTQRGLAVYNPVSETCQEIPVGPEGLPSDNIFLLKFDSQNKRMLIATGAGLGIYKGNFDFSLPYSHLPEDWEVHFGGEKSIHDLEIDRSGNIWVVGSKEEVFKQDGATWIACDTSNSLVKNPYDIASDKDGNIWISCHLFLVKFDGSNWEKIDGVNAGHMEIDKDNNLWAMEADFLVNIDLNSSQLVVEKEDKDNFSWLNKGEYEILSINNVNGNLLIGGDGIIVEHEKVVEIIFTSNKNPDFLPIVIQENYFKVLKPGNFVISLFKANGQTIEKISKYYPVGNYYFPFSYSSGTYFVKFQTKNSSYNSKIVISR